MVASSIWVRIGRYNMPFANTQLAGLNLGIFDGCFTPFPTPFGPIPILIPYPNITMPMMSIPSQFKMFTLCMPNHNLMTIAPMSMGDNMGILLNPLSACVMGPTRHLIGSFKTLIGGLPATKFLSPTGQNGMSPGAFGMTLSPCQLKLCFWG
jgi:hypothetical protein